MALTKNEYPILEYDTSVRSIFDTKDIKESLKEIKLPEKAVFAFLGGCIDEYAESTGAEKVYTIESITKDYPIYITEHNGEKICLCQAPMGAPAALQNLEILFSCGVKKVISAGSCGVLQDIPENHFIIPTKALRDEGCSYHYLPPSRFVDLDMPMTDHIRCVLSEKAIPFSEGITWTTDGLFRETHEMVAYRKSEGCTVVDMECASLAACAKFRGADLGMFFFTADSLANTEAYDLRDFGKASLVPALHMCIDIISSAK